MTFVYKGSMENHPPDNKSTINDLADTIKKTNRCQRLTHKMISYNSDRKLAICRDIIDGTWSEWTDMGACKGLEEVEGTNYICGPGYKQRQRNCTRTLGGKFCQIDGQDYKGTIMRNSVECDSRECPG